MRSHRPSHACYMSRPQQPTGFTAQRDQIVPHPRILFSLLDPCVLIIRLTNERKLHNMESSILLSKWLHQGGGGRDEMRWYVAHTV